MKNTILIIFISLLFATIACNKNKEPFGFYRASHPQNFITKRGAELYAYAANDSVLIRADYYLKMLGQIKTYGSEILEFGHCWSSSASNPLIGVDTLMTRKVDLTITNVGTDSISFTGAATRLLANTKYYIRSYVISGDGHGIPIDTGYNPVATIVTTKDAIDEWFEVTGDRPQGARFGAIGFNFGDSLFFGTGSYGQNLLTNNLWMYDPKTDKWNGDFKPLISIDYYQGNWGNSFVNGIGFGIEFTDVNVPLGTKTRCIYVGLGDYAGDDQRIHKSQTLLQYDFSKGDNIWKETSIFSGGRRSGAVCFVIGQYAYIGTGKSDNLLPDWYVFIPALERDGDEKTVAWRSMGTNIPGELDNTQPGIPKPTIGRAGAIAFTMNGRGYFGLGYDAKGKFLNDFYEFRPNISNPVNGSWIKKANFPGTPRANAVAFAIGDQGYVGTGDNIVGNKEGAYTGQIFDDLWRFDPYNNKWFPIRDYTSNKTDRVNISKKVTEAVAFSSSKNKVGYVGFGIVPDSAQRAQDDFWLYRPYEIGKK